MNLFDKICAVLAIVLGGIFLLLGIPGIFLGCKANFTLPPILGVLPALIGWGIIKSIIVAWKNSSTNQTVTQFQPPNPPETEYPTNTTFE